METLFSINTKSRSAFFLEEEKYFPYIILGESYINTRSNYASSTAFKIEEIDRDSPIAYKNKQYFFRGIEENEEEDLVVLEEVPPKRKSTKHSSVIVKIKVASANELITPVLDVKRGGNHHNISTYLSELLGMPKDMFSVSKSCLFISNMKEISKVKDLKININNKSFNFTTLCPSVLLTNHNKSYRYLGVKSKRIKNLDIPTNIFTTQLISATHFLEDHLYNESNKFKTEISKIVIIGNQYMNTSQGSYLYDLIDLAEEADIPIHYYGTTDTIYISSLQEIIKEFEIYAWTPKYINQPDNIKFDIVKSNSAFHKSMEKINSYIMELEEQGLSYLKIRVMELKNLVFQQVYKDKQTTELLSSKLIDLQLFFSFDENILKEFYTLFDNRYPHNVTKQIKQHLEKDNEIVLVVPIHYKGPANRLIKDYDLENKVITSEDVPVVTDNSNSRFLLSPLPRKDLVKWLTRFKGEELTLLFPHEDIKNVNGFINYINKSIDKLEKNNLLNSLYPSNKEWMLPLLEEESYDIPFNHDVETPITEPNASFLSTLEEVKNNIEYKESNGGKTVKINRVFHLENFRFLASTQNFKPFYIDDQNFIKQDKNSKFQIGDQILLLDIPYSNELYYETLQKGENYFPSNFSHYSNINEIREMDIEWKKQLRDYYDKHRLTPTLLADRFAKVGFVKSVGFFQSWINPESVNLLPQDSDFIKYIGLLTENMKLQNNYMEYYNASRKLKREFRNIRRAMVNSLINNKYDEKGLSNLNITASIHTIIDIELKEDLYIDEFLSNRLI